MGQTEASGVGTGRREGKPGTSFAALPAHLPLGLGAGGSAAAHTRPGPSCAELDGAGRLCVLIHKGCGRGALQVSAQADPSPPPGLVLYNHSGAQRCPFPLNSAGSPLAQA